MCVCVCLYKFSVELKFDSFLLQNKNKQKINYNQNCPYNCIINARFKIWFFFSFLCQLQFAAVIIYYNYILLQNYFFFIFFIFLSSNRMRGEISKFYQQLELQKHTFHLLFFCFCVTFFCLFLQINFISLIG